MYTSFDCCYGTTIVTSDCTIVTSEQHLYQTIVQFDKTIELPRKFAIGSKHNYLYCYCPLVGILFEVLTILKIVLPGISYLANPTKCDTRDSCKHCTAPSPQCKQSYLHHEND